MDLSPAKYEVLEEMLLCDRPVKPTPFAKDIKREFPATMMHIIGLIRKGYVTSPEKGYYQITEAGKKALGVTVVDKQAAKAMLTSLPPEKAFHFYEKIATPLDLHARSLKDFSEKITQLSPEAIDFHVKREDFQAWLNDIGDCELSAKIELLKNRKLPPTEQKNKLVETIQNHYNNLTTTATQTQPT
ncbi:MAG: DUF5752 family protein [Candidatus Bathyarchaeota archaeon]|nr:DUF5752 family protein [Candidatus Bathyarchaeota archaeon]